MVGTGCCRCCEYFTMLVIHWFQHAFSERLHLKVAVNHNIDPQRRNERNRGRFLKGEAPADGEEREERGACAASSALPALLPPGCSPSPSRHFRRPVRPQISLILTPFRTHQCDRRMPGVDLNQETSDPTSRSRWRRRTGPVTQP